MKLLKAFEIMALEKKAARQMYQSLRKTAMKRLARLQRTGRDIYIDNIPKMKQAKDLTDEQIYDELKDVTLFLKNPFTLIRKVKAFEKQMVKDLNEAGYDFVNMENITRVNYMLGKMKEEAGKAEWNSDKALEQIEQFERLNISMEEFEKNINKFMELDPKTMEKMKPNRDGSQMSWSEMEERIKRAERRKK